MATPPRRRMTQAERRVRTRASLLTAAEELFSKRGYSATTVEAIAETAGYTTGALYDHFGNKQGVLIALIEHLMATDPLQWADVDPHESFPEQLRAVGRAAAANVAKTPEATKFWHDIHASAARNPELKEQIAKLFRQGLRERGQGIPLTGGPLTGTDVIVLAQALLDGLRVRAGLNPELVRPQLFEEGLALLAQIPGLAELVESANLATTDR